MGSIIPYSSNTKVKTLYLQVLLCMARWAWTGGALRGAHKVPPSVFSSNCVSWHHSDPSLSYSHQPRLRVPCIIDSHLPLLERSLRELVYKALAECWLWGHRLEFGEVSGHRVLIKRGPGNRGPTECGTTHEATSGMSS